MCILRSLITSKNKTHRAIHGHRREELGFIAFRSFRKSAKLLLYYKLKLRACLDLEEKLKTHYRAQREESFYIIFNFVIYLIESIILIFIFSFSIVEQTESNCVQYKQQNDTRKEIFNFIADTFGIIL